MSLTAPAQVTESDKSLTQSTTESTLPALGEHSQTDVKSALSTSDASNASGAAAAMKAIDSGKNGGLEIADGDKTVASAAQGEKATATSQPPKPEGDTTAAGSAQTPKTAGDKSDSASHSHSSQHNKDKSQDASSDSSADDQGGSGRTDSQNSADNSGDYHQESETVTVYDNGQPRTGILTRSVNNDAGSSDGSNSDGSFTVTNTSQMNADGSITSVSETDFGGGLPPVIDLTTSPY